MEKIICGESKKENKGCVIRDARMQQGIKTLLDKLGSSLRVCCVGILFITLSCVSVLCDVFHF